MDIRARDIMVTEFDTIKSSDTVQEAVKLMKFDTDNPKGRRVFGIMVTNDAGELAGMISMYDILFHVRPHFMNAWEKNTGLSWHGQFNAACLKAKNLKIGDIMIFFNRPFQGHSIPVNI